MLLCSTAGKKQPERSPAWKNSVYGFSGSGVILELITADVITAVVVYVNI